MSIFKNEVFLIFFTATSILVTVEKKNSLITGKESPSRARLSETLIRKCNKQIS